jgi:hypothetical protein
MATSVDDSDDLDNELDNELDDELADYQPEDLAEPILPEPVREDFFDAKYPNRLQQIVSDKIYNKRDDLRSTKKYRYTPLGENQIRLVLLQPGEEKDPIKCKVLYKRLDDPQVAKRYFALSYHWGTDEPMNDIWIIDPRVDPRSESRPNILLTKQNKFASFVSQLKEQKPNDEWWFLVRDNLYNALRALRRHMMANAKDKEKAKMLIYIDAICINQDPIDEGAKIEKRQQVSKMAQIYNTARSVCIWLGEGNDATETAMPFIKKIVKDMPNLDSYLNDEESFSKWMAFKDLMTYKWFSRRWVVQEVALARKATVHCGNEV